MLNGRFIINFFNGEKKHFKFFQPKYTAKNILGFPRNEYALNHIQRLDRLLAFYLFFLACVIPSTLKGNNTFFSFSPTVEKVYLAVINLRLNEAQSDLRVLKLEDPNNLALDFIEDDIDFLKIYLSEDKVLFKQLEKNENVRLSRLEAEINPKSPYTLYVKAEILLHWGMIHLKFGNYLSAFTRIKKAYRLLNDNQKLFPPFSPNLKSLGVIHGMLGTVPNEVKWVLKNLGGMEGSIDQAKFELEQVLNYKDPEFIFKNEAIVMYGLFISILDNNPVEGRNLIYKSTLDPSSSPLITFIFASLAMKTNENDLAIQYLQSSPSGEAYFYFPYLDFTLGLAKLRRLDVDASIFFHKYLDHFKGTHFIKECYQKLAWAALIQHNKAGYIQNMEEARKKGASVMDEDKQALHEAERSMIPDSILLKARLLSDGGYLSSAEILIKTHEYVLTSRDHSLESHYRLARIYDLQGKYNQAIAFYLQVIDQGINSRLHYACASSLYIGTIYELLKDTIHAMIYYQKCLSITSADYSSGLHQKAKAGLNRLGK